MNADQDLSFAIGWNRLNLGLVGIWPDPLQGPGQSGGLSRCRFLIASFLMLGFICIPQSVNLFFIWGNAEMMTENLATANIPVTNAFMKAFTMWHHRKALKPLVDFFYQDWHASKTLYEKVVMLRSASVARKISIWCTVLTQTMVTLYIVLRISVIVRLQRNDPARPLIYTAYFPFDVSRSPIFELVCLGQILSAYSSTASYTGTVSFISMLVLHVCGQFLSLRERLKNIADGVKTVEEFRDELAQIVKRHEHLNWFAKTIEDSFNMVLLMQIFSCTVQLCFQGFQVFNIIINGRDESLTFQLIFLAMFVAFILIHLYVYCYIGEMLLVQSTEIGFSAYESNWFNVPGKEARNLLLIMHRSTMPLCLTAGKFGVFSLQMFSKIVRSSLGYLSVLLTVTNSKE
ncbi:odorant receptor 13a-like [Harpegnathos saltator]|uniref:odorant receptor 13a-like n=1 Tax=Harpegnathos saltator TaxID=610380 RepID=UPI000948B95B|nr:odorant receptor 13a-like [Harpegnathos saltator]